jgi:hypothetical protein
VVERQQEEALGEGRLAPQPRSAGRAQTFALGWIVGFLLLGYAALRALELAPHRGSARPPDETPVEAPDLGAWQARVEADTVRILARLLPLHDEPVLEEFRSRSLRERYELPPGRPWRLYLELEAGAEAPGTVQVSRAEVPGVLQAFAALARPRAGRDPVHALLAAPPGPLESERARPLVLWGERIEEGAELELELGGPGEERRILRARLERLPQDTEVTRWYAEEARRGGRERSLEAEVARLEEELRIERARRAAREEDLLQFGRMLAGLPVAGELGLAPTPGAPPPPSPEELARIEDETLRRARAEELGRALGVLMRLEGLRGLDLLDPGTLQPGPPQALGPVVFRCLDERGALTGSVRAERLRLEGSTAAHTLTLVLEDGYESRGGAREPFLGGVRRITLREVDPEPWLADCPELFAEQTAAIGDDGRWPLAEVRRELNRLLALDTHLGWYRLHTLGGVRGAVLLDVMLEELDVDGRLERRYFADRLVLGLEDASVVLELEGGAIVRGGEKTPFRDGRHRLVLPGVTVAPWRAARLPGFSTPSPPPARPEEPTEARAGATVGG